MIRIMSFFRKEVIYRLICVVIFLLLWHLFAFLYNSPLFPTPMMTFKSFLSILEYEKSYNHILITTFRVLTALSIAMVIGSIIGILPRYNKQVKYFIETVIYPIIQSVPGIVWILLFAVWFGLSSINPIIVASFIALPYVFIPISQGTKELDKHLIELGLSFTRKKVKILKKIIIPLLYPYFFTALRSTFGFIWRSIMIVEIFLAVNGMGYMMGVARETLNISRILAWAGFISIIMIFFEYVVFKYIEEKTVKKGKK